MSRLLKEKMVERYQARFRGVTDMAVVCTQGVNVQGMTALRSALRARGLRAMVIHNRIGRRALAGVGLDGLKDLLRGPTTLVWGGGTIVEIAKAIVAEQKTLAALKIRGGITGGQVVSEKDIEALSKMPGREELLARIAGLAVGPAARVAAQVRWAGGRIAAQVQECRKKAEAAAPQAEAPAAAPQGSPPAAQGAPQAAQGSA